MTFLSTVWTKIISIGHRPGMDYTQQMRLFTINAFLAIALSLALIFCLVFFALGSDGALEGLWLIPFVGLIFL